MNILESWKKQITFLQNKDARTIFMLALKRQIHVLLSAPGYFFLLILFVATYFLLRYQSSDFIHPVNAIIAFAIFLLILFLRPSMYKKDWGYVVYVTKKCFFTMLVLSLFASLFALLVSTALSVRFALFSSTFLWLSLDGELLWIQYVLFSSILLLLSLDGEYRIKNTFAFIKKAGLFFLYTLPTMVILSCIPFILLKLLKHTVSPYHILGVVCGSLLFSSIFALSMMLFMFIYIVDVYEHEQLYFESSEEKNGE